MKSDEELFVVIVVVVVSEMSATGKNTATSPILRFLRV